MNNRNLTIGFALALAIIAALLVTLSDVAADWLGLAVIVDGVSSQAWFDSIKPIEF